MAILDDRNQPDKRRAGGGLRKKRKLTESVSPILSTDDRARELYLFGGVDINNAGALIIDLRRLDRKPGGITLIMSSLGGEEGAGWAIYDAIRGARNPVTCKVFGECQSIATLILQACHVRLLSPHTRFMIHNGSLSADVTANQAIALGKEIQILSEMYYGILAHHSGIPAEEIEILCQNDYFMSAEAAVQRGFADGLVPKEVINWKKSRKS